MKPPSALYDRLKEFVPVIVEALETHGAHNGLVDEDLVLQRLESSYRRHPDCLGECLVNRVLTSFLVDYGLVRSPSDSPDVQIVDFVEPKVPAEPSTSSVNSAASTSKGPVGIAASCRKALSEESNIETSTLSSGLCQARPSKRLVSYASSPEEDKEETVSNGERPARINPKIPSIKSESAKSASESTAAAYTATLNEMFPEADPQYLWENAEQIRNDDELNTLIERMVGTDGYPRIRRGSERNSNVSAAAGVLVQVAHPTVVNAGTLGCIVNINLPGAVAAAAAAAGAAGAAGGAGGAGAAAVAAAGASLTSKHPCFCGKAYASTNRLWNHQEKQHKMKIKEREERRAKQNQKDDEDDV